MRWGFFVFSRLCRSLPLLCYSGARVLVTKCDPAMLCKHAWKVSKWYVTPRSLNALPIDAPNLIFNAILQKLQSICYILAN